MTLNYKARLLTVSSVNMVIHVHSNCIRGILGPLLHQSKPKAMQHTSICVNKLYSTHLSFQDPVLLLGLRTAVTMAIAMGTPRSVTVIQNAICMMTAVVTQKIYVILEVGQSVAQIQVYSNYMQSLPVDFRCYLLGKSSSVVYIE